MQEVGTQPFSSLQFYFTMISGKYFIPLVLIDVAITISKHNGVINARLAKDGL
jgi:hypothetical protein